MHHDVQLVMVHVRGRILRLYEQNQRTLTLSRTTDLPQAFLHAKEHWSLPRTAVFAMHHLLEVHFLYVLTLNNVTLYQLLI